MKQLWLAALAAALIYGGAVHAQASAPDDQPATGVVARYLLMDHRGRAVSQEDFRGRFQLIAFGYTYCPDICPTTLAEMALILDRLGREGNRLQPLFVTVDPERDTPEVLRRYTEFFDKRIIGLTGSPELIRRIAQHFKVRYEKVQEPGAEPGKYAMDHSAGMYLLGPDGGFITKFAYATPPDEIVRQLRPLMEKTGARRP